jgi:hypothetical protein
MRPFPFDGRIAHLSHRRLLYFELIQFFIFAEQYLHSTSRQPLHRHLSSRLFVHFFGSYILPSLHRQGSSPHLVPHVMLLLLPPAAGSGQAAI